MALSCLSTSGDETPLRTDSALRCHKTCIRLVHGAGIEVPDTDGMSPEELAAASPEDYWSPCLEVPYNHKLVENYGLIKPVPSHDGTACFQWDNTLWSAEGHFRVRLCALRRSRRSTRVTSPHQQTEPASVVKLFAPVSRCDPQYRWKVFRDIRNAIDANEGGLAKFAEGESYPATAAPSLPCAVASMMSVCTAPAAGVDCAPVRVSRLQVHGL